MESVNSLVKMDLISISMNVIVYRLQQSMARYFCFTDKV